MYEEKIKLLIFTKVLQSKTNYCVRINFCRLVIISRRVVNVTVVNMEAYHC
jgi:hypothetical protein